MTKFKILIRLLGIKRAMEFNRYAKIHGLFSILAIVQYHNKDKMTKVKSYHKNLFDIGSLTELTNERLQELEELVEAEINSSKTLDLKKWKKENE